MGYTHRTFNLSEHMGNLALAKYIFNSDAYALLPRHLRHSLVRYICYVMIELKMPYEPMPGTQEMKIEWADAKAFYL